MVHQIWCHCPDGRPIVAVVALDQEALFRWYKAERLDFRQREENAPAVAKAVLEQLHGVADTCELQPWERVHAVRVVESLSHAHEGYANIATPTFALPRKGLRQRYAADLQALYEGLDCPSAALPPASPEGAAAAATRGGARHASRLPDSSLAALRVSRLSESAAGLLIPRQGAEEAGATE